jgi:predicted Abi (CAAX) family protease
MAKLLIATESLSKVDPKIKKDLKEHHKQQQRQRRESRLKRHTRTIRQLLDQGGSREDIEAVLETLQTESDLDMETPHQPDQDSVSDSSSSE